MGNASAHIYQYDTCPDQKQDTADAFGRCVELFPNCREAVERLEILRSMLADPGTRPHPPYVDEMVEPELVHVDSAAEATQGDQSESIVLNDLNLPPEDFVSDDDEVEDDEWETDVDEESDTGERV